MITNETEKNSLDKIKYINEYDILTSVKEHIEVLAEKDSNNVLVSLLFETNKKLESYSHETYKLYKNDIMEEYKNDIIGLKMFIGKNLSDSINKIFWLKYINDNKDNYFKNV